MCDDRGLGAFDVDLDDVGPWQLAWVQYRDPDLLAFTHSFTAEGAGKLLDQAGLAVANTTEEEGLVRIAGRIDGRIVAADHLIGARAPLQQGEGCRIGLVGMDRAARCTAPR